MRIPQRFPAILRARLLSFRKKEGQAMVEAALVIPILLLLLLGLIESGNGLAIKHKLAVLSREGANIAARGTTLEETLDVVMAGGDEIQLMEHGGAIVSRIVVSDGEPVIDAQATISGFERESRLGLTDETVLPLTGITLVEGQVFHAVEIIYNYEPMTPLGKLLPSALTDEVYERAFF
jgi:hypothetical protein